MKVISLLRITVCTAVLLATWQLFIHPLGITFQWIFFSILVFVLGVPHGALDLYVQQRANQLTGKRSRTSVFFFRYIFLMFFYAVTWYVFPAVAFVLFLFISCLHFGETDLSYFMPGFIQYKAISFFYGVALLLVLLLPHLAEVKIVVQQLLTGYQKLPLYFSFIETYKLVIICSSIFFMLIIVAAQIINKRDLRVLNLIILLALLLYCCSVLPLLPAFALYFVGWHSIISFYQIGNYIDADHAKHQHQNVTFSLLKKGFPFSVLALTGLMVTAFVFYHFSLPVKPLPVVLIFLSLITLPHLYVMNQLNKQL